MAFRLVRQWKEGEYTRIEYRADFFEAPERPGDNGKHNNRLMTDTVMVRRDRDGRVARRSLLSTSPSVSYYPELRRILNLT